MNAPISTDKDVLPLADQLRPALLRASRMLRREAQRAGRLGSSTRSSSAR